LLARSYLDWGFPLHEGRFGAVAVLSRGSDPARGHVGFLLGSTSELIFLLGGNQSNAVTLQAFERSRLLSLRWPAAAGSEPGVQSPPLFERALAHVLEMEGGYSEDPHDPGGPTNRGITLAALAAYRGIEINVQTAGPLKAELKQIAPDTVRDIYLTRYWRPASCNALPPPAALMHFDAAVNHGVGAASRMLQDAAGAMVDGEIGPGTLGAVQATPMPVLLRRYADLRRARYRGLGHFWRFGRGWLRRVERTLERATALDSNNSQLNKGEQRMTQRTETTAKWWGQSMTIWGAIITALSTVLPVIGPLFGLDITSDLVRQLGDHVVQVVQAIGGLAGIVLTIYGRTRASTRLERREVTIQL
jgi:lysozyme family protein